MKDIKEVMKGLTFESTEAEGYNQLRKLRFYMEILEETLSDNFYEVIWYEGMSGEEAKANMLGALSAFTDKLEEFTLLDKPVEPTNVEKNKGEEVTITKSVETTESVETAPATEEVILEGEEQASNPEQVEDKAPEQISTETKEEATQADVAVEPTEVVEEVSAEASSKLNVEYLSSVNLDELSDDEVEELYNEASYLIDDLMNDDKVRLLASASDILEKIDALIESSNN